MNTADLFNLSNAAVLPFWALMFLLPNWRWTRKIMGSMLYFVPLILLYVYLIASSLNAETAAALANPKLADIARFFGEETAAATGWTHFLVMDLFVGRWVYWEGQRTGVWSRHSILLCLFAGPLGLLSHIVTAAIYGQWFGGGDGPADPAANASEAA
jgi:hypothetical protein